MERPIVCSLINKDMQVDAMTKQAGAETLGESMGSFLAWPKTLLNEVGSTILLQHFEQYH